MLNLYRATAFLSAALLFMAQPLFARQVLPLVGGAPAVWNTCQVFFQVALLAGYLYAHFASQWLGSHRQSVLHIGLILLPIVCLPIVLKNAAPPDPDANPSPWLLALMATTIGPPFLALAATAPLVQRWFASAHRDATYDPYSLYVMSNCGSLAALIAYPLLIEPTSTLTSQTWAWSAGYILLVACLAGCAFFVWKAGPPLAVVEPEPAPVEPPVNPRAKSKREKKSRRGAVAEPATAFLPPVPTTGLRLRWLALAGVPVAWMLGATTWITTDIAPVPLLWIVPLAIYLLTYIIAFSKFGADALVWALRILPWAMCALVASLTAIGLWQLSFVHILAFACGAIVLHGQLARLRPSPERLTEFYVWLSVGGALGGVFVALVAPLIFVVPLEYAIAVGAGYALAPQLAGKPNRVVDLICITAVFAMLLTLRSVTLNSYKADLLFAAVFCVPAMLWFQYRRWNVPFAIVLALVLAVDIGQPLSMLVTLRVARSYFGVHRVIVQVEQDQSVIHKLEHGTTAHGMQFMDAARQCQPLVYYHQNGPLGEIMRAFAPGEGEKQHIAAVGLGAGAVACYTGPQRDVTFFEIDHVVREIAEDPDFFTYLSNCARGRYTIRMGDGRRLLKQEPAGRYQVMLLDAFSSDAIPVHLLTREALEIYMSRLAPDGILAFHVSNNHLDLTPVVTDLAHAAGYTARVRNDMRISEEELDQLHVGSNYVVVVRQPEYLRGLADDPNWRARKPTGRAIWTDEFSNVLSVLKTMEQRRTGESGGEP